MSALVYRIYYKKLGKIDKKTRFSERNISFYITSLINSIIPEHKSQILYYTIISCLFVKTITQMGCGRPLSLFHKAEGRVHQVVHSTTR